MTPISDTARSTNDSMSDEPRAPWTKAVPQLLGIAVLAIVFVSCLNDGHQNESPIRQAEGRNVHR
jgi:hypothetical protein